MPIRIGVPNNKQYDFLIENFKQVQAQHSLKLIRDTEDKILQMFKGNLLEVALLSPFSYGKGMSDSDFRIVPTHCIALENYTGFGSIYFNRNANQFKTMACEKENSYLTIVSRIIMAERYNSFPEIDEMKPEKDKMLSVCDTAVLWEKSNGNEFALDLSEQWFDTYEFPLPLAMWVTKSEDYPENIVSIIDELTNSDKLQELINEDIDINGSNYIREGIIHKYWDDDIENSLFQTLELLFLLQIFTDIPAVKVLGRD
jgi:predicted solute-binding protein